MKKDWTYKKLGDICDIINGKNQRAVENPDGIYPIMGSGGIMGYADDYLCKEGTTIIGRKGTINRPIYVEHKFWNVDTAFGLQPKAITNSRFLYYLCKSINFDRYNKSVTIPSLVKSDLLKIDIKVPEVEEQKEIVSELDLLSGVIEKQKAQLEELDKLAQSIFYDMFGDPVTNEKMWESKPLSFVAPQKEYKGNVPSEDGKYWLLNLDMIQSQTGEIINKLLVSKEDIGNSTIAFNENNILYSKLRPYLNKVVIPQSCGYATSELLPLKPDPSLLDRFFLAYLLRSKQFVEFINIKVQGAKMPRVSMNVLRAFPIILPPLSLQQEFAAKVEAIETMKEKVRQSLKEAETLFNSRMDYYFN